MSRGDARKLALFSQRLPTSGLPRGLAGVREAIRHLGYVQIDTLSVVARAHHHTLWVRVPGYSPRHLDRLVSERAIFEYWAHAAAYLPMEDFRFCLPRMHTVAGAHKHWFPRNPKLMREVLARIRSDGPLQARDFDTHRGASGMWEWGPVKQAIERLFMEGKVLVTRRDRFQKLFDLTERVVPAWVDTTMPSQREYAHHLVDRSLCAHGLARANEMGYQRKGMGQAIERALSEKLESGQVHAVKIHRVPGRYYAAADFEDRLHRRLGRRRLRVLSPFDNLVIQRQRILKLFDYDYQLECYTPAAKRRFGYFCLPVLWQGKLVARMDAKADRANRRFVIRQLHLEKKVRETAELGARLHREIAAFADFNGCSELVLGSSMPRSIRDSIVQSHRRETTE